MSRFREGDVVVLNGDRVEVCCLQGADRVHLNSRSGEFVVVPERWLPDPEPRAEPEWQAGDVVRDADGRIYVRTSGTRPWRQLGNEVGENILTRPLVRLVQKPDPPTFGRIVTAWLEGPRGYVELYEALFGEQP